VDEHGVVWFATSRGVSAFSGTAWQTFNSSNSPLSGDVVSAIVLDEDGNRWFATEGGGVNRLSAARETDIGHGAAFHDNLVQVERVRGAE